MSTARSSTPGALPMVYSWCAKVSYCCAFRNARRAPCSVLHEANSSPSSLASGPARHYSPSRMVPSRKSSGGAGTGRRCRSRYPQSAGVADHCPPEDLSDIGIPFESSRYPGGAAPNTIGGALIPYPAWVSGDTLRGHQRNPKTRVTHRSVFKW